MGFLCIFRDFYLWLLGGFWGEVAFAGLFWCGCFGVAILGVAILS
jgi:hypothetical protein